MQHHLVGRGAEISGTPKSHKKNFKKSEIYLGNHDEKVVFFRAGELRKGRKTEIGWLISNGPCRVEVFSQGI